MPHIQVPPLTHLNDGIGGVTLMSTAMSDLLGKVLVAEGANAWNFFEAYRADLTHALKNSHGTGPMESEHQAVDYGIRAINAVFDAVKTQFDDNKVFRKDR